MATLHRNVTTSIQATPKVCALLLAIAVMLWG
jgi:hypothetical protein